MVLRPTPRSGFFDALVAEIAHNYGRGRVIVGVDGLVHADEFGADLVRALDRAGLAAFGACLDDFQRPRSERRLSGEDSAEAYYLDRYDYRTFRRVLVEPFRMGGSAGFVTAAFDAERDARIEPSWLTAAQDALLVVSGPFLARPELHGLFNYSVFLESSAPPGPAAAAGELYTAEAEPRFAATAVIDMSDPLVPRRVFSDSC